MSDYILVVPDTLFMPAESADFSGQFRMEKLEAGPDVYTFSEPLSWSVSLQNTGDAILVTGSVSARAATECARCLDDFSVDLQGELEGYYLINSSSAPGDMDDDEFDVLPESHEIDLMPLVVAALLMELPLVPLCKDDCLGLCAQCGANLNEGPCACQQGDDKTNEDADVPYMSDGRISPFASLKDFKFE